MVPVIASAGAAVAAIGRALAAGGPSLLAKVQTRLNLPNASISTIMAAIKESPVTAALVALEIGDAAEAALDWFRSDSEEVKSLIDGMTQFDPPPKDGVPIMNIGAYKDEMRAIDNAAAVVGGFDRLLNLKRVLEMDESFFVLRQQLRSLGSGL